MYSPPVSLIVLRSYTTNLVTEIDGKMLLAEVSWSMMQPNHQLPGHREHLPVLVHDGTTAPRRSSWLPLTDPRNRKMNGPDHQSEPASSHSLTVC